MILQRESQYITNIFCVCVCVYVHVWQKVGFLPSAGEAVTWQTLHQPVRTFQFKWTVLDVSPSPEEDNPNYCKHTELKRKKNCSVSLSPPHCFSLFSWFGLWCHPGETIQLLQRSPAPSGGLHPRSENSRCRSADTWRSMWADFFHPIALPGGPHSQFPAEWNNTTAGLVQLGFAVLMGESSSLQLVTFVSF